MKISIACVLSLIPLLASAQTVTPVTAPIVPVPVTVQSSTLPPYIVGTGLAWNRFSGTPFSNVTTLGVRISNTNIYSWSTVDTPLTVPSPGQPPQTSSVRTGAAYVFAQSASAGVSAFALGDFGLTTTPSATLPQYSGGVGLTWRIGKSNFYVMPMYRALSVPAGPGVTSGVELVPEIQLAYALGQHN